MLNKYYDDVFCDQIESEVMDVFLKDDLYYHALKETNFYVESGGMPSDKGWLNDLEVEDVRVKDQRVYHGVKQKLSGVVRVTIDMDNRFKNMQHHTSQHIICSYINKVHDGPTIMFKSNDDVCVIEMGLKTLNEEMMQDIEQACNRFILQDLKLELLYPSKQEALSWFANAEKMINEEGLRVVKYGDVDFGLCGCLQLPSLHWLQAVKLLSYEKTTRGYKIEYVVGHQLLQYVDGLYATAFEVSKLLACPIMHLDQEVHKQLEDKKLLMKEIEELKNERMQLQFQQLPKDIKLFLFVENQDVKDFVRYCSFITNHSSRFLMGLCRNEEKCHVVVACSKDLNVKANEVFKALQSTFEIKGGGNVKMAQGGAFYSETLHNEMKSMVLSTNIES